MAKVDLPLEFGWASNCTASGDNGKGIFCLLSPQLNENFSICKMTPSVESKTLDDLRSHFDKLPIVKITVDDDRTALIEMQRAAIQVAKVSKRAFANVLLKTSAQTITVPPNMNVYTVSDSLLKENELILMYSGNTSADRLLFITEIDDYGNLKRFDMHPQYLERCVKLVIENASKE